MSEEKDPKYPKSVFFIISNEFCERFSYYGMKTVLSLYLTTSLRFDKDTATVLFHVFAMLCYFFPLCGAIIADSLLGKFKTILYLSILYACGNIVLSVASVPVIPLPHRAISLLGLLFIAIGTGGIKPCVSSFGGDQFFLPEQTIQLQQFFSVFYFAINAGSLISTILTPSLRNDVKCFGQESCFALAFGVPAILMIISVVVFIAGKNMYRIKQPEENVIMVFITCIWSALKNKIIRKTKVKKEHWLEYADEKYSKQQIFDIRSVLNVLYLFMPVPLFWALFDQQGSRWTYQATNMDGRIFGYTIKPDQMQAVNPLLILAFIPIFEVVIYPMLKFVGIKRPLQKLVIGGFLAAIAFICSAIVESHVEESYGVQPVPHMSQLRIFNALNCEVTLNPPIENASSIAPLSDLELLHIPVIYDKTYDTTVHVDESCASSLNSYDVKIIVEEKKAKSFFITTEVNKLFIIRPPNSDKLDKNVDGAVQIRLFYSSSGVEPVLALFQDNKTEKNSVIQKVDVNMLTNFIFVTAGTYNLIVNNETVLKDVILNPGEINTVLLHQNADNITGKIINMVPPNSVHLLWQLPQIIILTAGEIMFSITGLEFSFTQAPESMKSVLSAAWLLTVAFGNLIVAVIAEIKFFNKQTYEFLLYAFLMVIDVFWLIILCMRYKYVSYNNNFDHNGSQKSRNNGTEFSTQMTDISTLTSS